MIDRYMEEPSTPDKMIATTPLPLLSEHGADVGTGGNLLRATAPFAVESKLRSWWYVSSTYVLLIISLAATGMVPWWPLRSLISIFSALLMVRAFITYHDYMHGAILRDSFVARILFRAYSAFALAPPNAWRKSHNHHHGHVGQADIASIGSFPIITAQMWRDSSFWQRLSYRVQRHPLVVVFGYVTIFTLSLCVFTLVRNPRRYWDSAVVLSAHVGLIVLLWSLGGFDVVFFVVLLPMTIASALGSYLFFAQHSFKGMHIISPATWTLYRAALESSSYLHMNKAMQWFTGNIGFHHIHHMNLRIPFYRLPEAMAAIPELQSPLTTTLSLRDIIDSFKSCLWDENKQRMITYRQAKHQLDT